MNNNKNRIQPYNDAHNVPFKWKMANEFRCYLSLLMVDSVSCRIGTFSSIPSIYRLQSTEFSQYLYFTVIINKLRKNDLRVEWWMPSLNRRQSQIVIYSNNLLSFVCAFYYHLFDFIHLIFYIFFPFTPLCTMWLAPDCAVLSHKQSFTLLQ